MDRGQGAGCLNSARPDLRGSDVSCAGTKDDPTATGNGWKTAKTNRILSTSEMPHLPGVAKSGESATHNLWSPTCHRWLPSIQSLKEGKAIKIKYTPEYVAGVVAGFGLASFCVFLFALGTENFAGYRLVPGTLGLVLIVLGIVWKLRIQARH